MITELYEALLEIHIPSDLAIKVNKAIEKKIIDSAEKIKLNLMVEKFLPYETENIGIRAEIKYLGERMERGFIETDKRMHMIIDQMNAGFAETDKKIHMVIDQMKTGFAESDKKINLLYSAMDKRLAFMEKLQISMLGCLIGLVIKFLIF